ncbi:hypothetical protein [Methylobacterium indicum]|uniref:Uncharacterized protein n=1 Tax=Methylobacterium indicum TaxID=1775910 RepID=A0A8H8X0E3_9HYPH|nr:hypothetical protein [Methylobacterium indicum]BCM88060.1 hypothetical protein mvi_65210 [Methylobacterium indicum]
MFGKKLKTNEVFGISNNILEHSYVDRGNLDETINLYLGRKTHLALRGESKCGKSWLRQRTMPDAIIVQCRLNRTVADLYVDALSQLGIKLTIEESSKNALKGSVEATQEIGSSIFAKLGFKQSVGSDSEISDKKKAVGQDINDLRYIADIIRVSGRRLVIEDFHYLSQAERKSFAFDLKAMWDYGCFITLIGVWVESNLLLHLNPDLSGRIHEINVFWSKNDLRSVIDKGSNALNILFDEKLTRELVSNSFETVGILQTLILSLLDHIKVYEQQSKRLEITDMAALEGAAMQYAEQLNGIYQTFAKRVTKGIRNRSNSTAIYAHMLSVVMASSNDILSKGLSLDYIFKEANARQPRIQKGNLRTVMDKIDALQIDDDGRGLVMTYDGTKEEVSIVDHQLFLYRKYATIRWPWEDILENAKEGDSGLEADDTE